MMGNTMKGEGKDVGMREAGIRRRRKVDKGKEQERESWKRQEKVKTHKGKEWTEGKG